MATTEIDLPLKWMTPVAWAKQILAAPLELLNDHAHLEKKAASNALELLNRWPEPRPPENWIAAMTAIARDETEHLAHVCRILVRRGGRLSKSHSNPYAAALHRLVRKGASLEELVDRLLISALIEARSCERFNLLGDACDHDPELRKLYRGLWASEHGHYKTFVQLAEEIQDRDVIARRWEQMLHAEADVISHAAPAVRMHGGVSSSIDTSSPAR